MSLKNINIGVLAHVDAGKTTLTEHLMFNAGVIRTIGSVDKGSASTDNLALEKERGISIKAAATSFVWKNTKINLIDTPGHVDFSSEVERVLCVVDAVILVISAVEGIQAHTLNIYDSLKEMKIPTIIFINKIDRQGADIETVVIQLEKELKIKPVIIFNALNEGLSNATIVSEFNDCIHTSTKEKSIEHILDGDEQLLEKFLNSETINTYEYLKSLKQQTIDCKTIPVFTGIAKNNIGIIELLNGMVDYLPNTIPININTLSAYVFKLEQHKTHGTMAHVKVFSGELCSKSTIYNYTQSLETKINQTKQLNQNKYVDNVVLKSGDIGVITGVLNTKAGDVLGTPSEIPKLPQLHIPVLSVNVTPKDIKDYNNLGEALFQLDREDPSLKFKWFKTEKELQLLLMGQMQIEV